MLTIVGSGGCWKAAEKFDVPSYHSSTRERPRALESHVSLNPSTPPAYRDRHATDKRPAQPGKDPQGEKAKQREALTVEQLADAFLTAHEGAKRRSTTKAHYETSCGGSYYRRWGSGKQKM